jgi:integration host factor subunit alpha
MLDVFEECKQIYDREKLLIKISFRRSLMSNITKNSISDHLNEELGLSKRFCNDIVNSVFEEIISLAISDSNIKIKNFGSFAMLKKTARPGNIINENIKINIEERFVLKFSPSRNLKERINIIS